MRFAIPCLILGVLVAYIEAATTPTTPTPATQAVPDGTATTTATPTTTSGAISTQEAEAHEMLRSSLSVSPKSHRIRGRVVLANTRMDGSEEWGVHAEQAELACQRIARYQTDTDHPDPQSRAFMSEKRDKKGARQLEGHLLSIGSAYEVMALSRLLNPLPKGAYWTGGKLTRFRVNNMHHTSHTDHLILTWTDGRRGNPAMLGMTPLDEKELIESYTYCLALNLRTSSWQARDCSDLLPYACLITPRIVGFTNKASSTSAVDGISTTEAPAGSVPVTGSTTTSTLMTTGGVYEGTTIDGSGTTTPQSSEASAMTEQPETEITSTEPLLPTTSETLTTTSEGTEATTATSLLDESMLTTTIPPTTEMIEETESEVVSPDESTEAQTENPEQEDQNMTTETELSEEQITTEVSTSDENETTEVETPSENETTETIEEGQEQQGEQTEVTTPSPEITEADENSTEEVDETA